MIIVVLPSLTQKEWLAYLLGGVMPRTYRRFSREFKMQIVDSILKGAVAGQIAKANDLHPEVVRKWVRDLSVSERCVRRPRQSGLPDNAKVGELERQLGQMAAENLVLKKALQRIKDLARERGRVACLALASELAGPGTPSDNPGLGTHHWNAQTRRNMGTFLH